MANTYAGIAPQSKTYAAWVTANPTLGVSGYGQIVIATDSAYGDIMVWGVDQSFTTAYDAGQWFTDGGGVVQDWTSYDTSTIPGNGQVMRFYNNDAYGDDVRYHVIGDGATSVANLDRFLPQPASSNTMLYTRPSTLGYAADCKLVGVTVEGDDTARFLIDFCCYAKQDANTITLTGTTENNFQVSVGEYNSGNIDASSGVFSDVTVEGRLVFCRFTLADAFDGLTAFRGGAFTSVSTGLHFTLS